MSKIELKHQITKLRRAVKAAIAFLPVTDRSDIAGNWGLKERERRLFDTLRESLRKSPVN